MTKKTTTKKSAKKTTKKSGSFDFEKAMQDLETLVNRMEQGEQTLEQSLKDFEQGIALTRQCQAELEATELKIQQLIEKNGQEELVDFEEDY